MRNFEQLGVEPKFTKALTELGILIPSEIQQKAIPLLLDKNGDFIGQAQTGTGKTAAYGIPLLMKMDSNINQIQALILCPTRELSQQVAKQLFKFTKYSNKVFTEAVYGGEKIENQISALTRPTHIVVATPGRLIDLVNRKAIDIRKVHTVILDEADEMLSMGFKAELEEILGALSFVENKWLFSATMPNGIQDIVTKFLSKDAQRIKVNGKNVVNNQISHSYLVCEEKEKLNALLSFIKSEHKLQGLVFCRTKAMTQKLNELLKERGILTDCIHGDLSQKEREKALRAFKKGTVQILVATDVAARGIDIQDLAYVAHFQLPESEEYYTHRSGRTARAGKTGKSMVFVNANEIKQIRFYERNLGISFRQVRKIG